MNKNIFVIRHGHADFTAHSDFQRVLTTQGIQAATLAANFVKQQCELMQLKPAICISSAAIRTQQTAQIICKVNAIEQCNFHQELYSTTASTWLEKISQSDKATIIIVGHNPTFSQLVNILCGQEIYMQPANCAFISLEIKSDGFVFPAILNNFFNPKSRYRNTN